MARTLIDDFGGKSFSPEPGPSGLQHAAAVAAEAGQAVATNPVDNDEENNTVDNAANH